MDVKTPTASPAVDQLIELFFESEKEKHQEKDKGAAARRARPAKREAWAIRSAKPRTLPAARQAKILEQTQRWLGFLTGQGAQMTSIAERLLGDVTATRAFPKIFPAELPPKKKESLVSRIEWTLASVQRWIEEQAPENEDARLVLKWQDQDAVAGWESSGDAGSAPQSLLGIVEDAAEHDGGFAADVAKVVAGRIMASLKSGQPTLMHLEPIGEPVESSTARSRSVFRLRRRGEAYAAASAAAEGAPTALSEEVEAQFGEKAAVLARMVDTAICNWALVRYGSAAQRKLRPLRTPVARGKVPAQTVNRLVTRVARECGIRPLEVKQTVLLVAKCGFEASTLQDNQLAEQYKQLFHHMTTVAFKK